MLARRVWPISWPGNSDGRHAGFDASELRVGSFHRRQIVEIDLFGLVGLVGLLVGVFITLPDADTGSPVPPLLRLTGDPNVSCSTTGTVTECTYREPGPSGGPRP